MLSLKCELIEILSVLDLCVTLMEKQVKLKLRRQKAPTQQENGKVKGEAVCQVCLIATLQVNMLQ